MFKKREMAQLVCWKCGRCTLHTIQKATPLIATCPACDYPLAVLWRATWVDKLSQPLTWLKSML